MYGTTDIILAAYLLTEGHRLAEILKEGKQGTFYFDGVEQSELLDFDQGYAKVEPVAMSNNIKRLSSAVRRM